MQSSPSLNATEEIMAKGQMKSNKEKRKPKQDKGDKKGAMPSFISPPDRTARRAARLLINIKAY